MQFSNRKSEKFRQPKEIRRFLSSETIWRIQQKLGPFDTINWKFKILISLNRW